jgi:cytochrome c oxidase subunit 4
MPAASAASPRLRPCTWVWIGLLTLTAFTYAIAQAGLHGTPVVFAVLALVFVKTHWVAHHFMGLRQASWPWRAAMAAWQLAVAVGLGIAYLNTVSP